MKFYFIFIAIGLFFYVFDFIFDKDFRNKELHGEKHAQSQEISTPDPTDYNRILNTPEGEMRLASDPFCSPENIEKMKKQGKHSYLWECPPK
jgi:hypothetical protein